MQASIHSYDNPQGNEAHKEELLWLEEFESLAEAEEKIAKGNMSPEEFLRNGKPKSSRSRKLYYVWPKNVLKNG